MLKTLKAKKQLKGKSPMTSGNKYQVTIERKDNGKKISFVYHDNYKNESKLNDFMYAIISDMRAIEYCDTIKDFMKEFGYDSYEEAKKIFNGCETNGNKLKSMFTIEEIVTIEEELNELGY